MLESKGFIRWANEHVVVCVAHNEMGHDEVKEKDASGVMVDRCPLYPGLTCSEHVGIAVDLDNARGEGLVKVPFLELCPNSWIVSPTGEVTRIPEEVQFDEKKVREQVDALQKTLGPILPEDRFQKVLPLWEKVQPAVDEDRFNDALVALVGVEKEAKEPQAPLKALIEAHLTTLDENVTFAFEDVRDSVKRPLAERKAEMAKIAAAVDVAVLGRRLPVLEAMKAWLAAN